MSFAPKPSFNRWNRAEQIQLAMDEPFTFGQAFGENVVQGALDSFGLGTAVREFTTPPLLSDRPFRGETRENYEARLRRFEEQAMSEDQYKSSVYFRPEVKWERGMTEQRAAALAQFTDKRNTRAYFSEKQPIAAFLGGFVGQAFDPINYIPVFGPAAHTAAIAKFGSIGGRALMGASEAAINTAAFGVLTAGIRERLGDDVSFAAITNEVAVSALIGGAFGTGIGLLARGGDARRRMAEAKVRENLDTLANTQRAMIPLGEAATTLASEGRVRMSPNGLSTIERIRAEVATRDATGRALETETADVVGTRAGQVVITPSGFKVNVRPEVVELDSLAHATGALQVRNRSTAASAAQVEQIATELDPARLMPNVSADQGAPLVGDDNIVDSGNGRVMAIRRAYEAYPERAEAYRQALADAGYDVSAMRNPVLIQRRVTPLSPDARSQFNADANSSSTARMSAVELAEMDRAALTDGVLDALDDGPVTAAGNRAFVARFLANLPPNERGALVDRDGNLSAEGARRIENSLVAAAYADVDAGVLRRFAEATDDNTRSIVGAMADVAGRWAQMRRAVRNGDVSPEFDTTPELTGALRSLGGWRDQAAREGRPVSVVIREGMAQMDLLNGELSPEAQTFVRMFYKTDQFSQVVGRDALAARLNRVIDSTLELGKPQLFAEAMPTKGEVIRNATDGLEADLFAPDSVVGSPEEIGAGGRPAGTGTPGAADRPGAGAGAQAQRLTDSPAFKRWFGDSKVVDADGNPLVVYHGSTVRGIDAFDPEKLNDKTRGTGFWFSEHDKASTYAGDDGEVYPVYLKMERPIIVEWNGHWADGPAVSYVEYRIKDSMGVEVGGRGYFEEKANAEAALARLKESGTDTTGFEIEEKPIRGEQTTDEWVRRLRRDNPDADGVILRNVEGGGEGAGGFAGLVNGDEYVVFSPTQIKSMNNSGRFDPDSPSIMDLVAGVDAKTASMAESIATGQPVNGAEPRPDPLPDGLDEAAARVGRPDTMKEMAEQFGVDEAGSFVEQGDIDRLKELGRLTPEELEALEAADAQYEDAVQYGEMLKYIAATCGIRG